MFDHHPTHPLHDQPTDHLLAYLEAWRGVGGDQTAQHIEAELIERGVPYSDFQQEEEAHH